MFTETREPTEEELNNSWDRCSVCKVSLNKITDSYRFTFDGKPICYDCAEEADKGG